MIKELIESRRLKILWIPEEAILGMFDRVKPGNWISRPFFALPEGTTVVKAILSQERMAFGFLLHNPKWNAVPLSEITPELPYIALTVEQPKICDFCKKVVPIGQFCTCKIADSYGCEKLCPKCNTKMSYYIYDCPKCGYKFD